MKLLFWFLKNSQQEPEVILSGSSPLQIRAAKTEDLSYLAEILANSFHSRSGITGWFYPLFRLGIYEDLRHRLQSSSSRYVCLVGIYKDSQLGDRQDQLVEQEVRGRTVAPPDRDCVVGTVEMSLRSTNPWQFYNSSGYPYLSNLAVQSEYRRRGVARQLLLACEQIALNWGYQDLYLHVLENNHKARGLYSQLGYRLHQVDSNWACLLLGKPRQLLLHKRLTSAARSGLC
ncbi:GNAT family N-acetyltransferase [Aerosakkonemataceae cyanobacterium BLCC-F50]|uniref:GNAT family N-acetyltransferase n=1 Tax=Floridaenema flaviceps BLCC-F50 TaxID=3153642 RepID=A0ABV4Y0V9_9CYAN